MKDIIERFKRYIAFDTMSSEESGTHPSTPSQIEFSKLLINDLKSLGVNDIKTNQYAYVYAFIDNNKEKTIGLISHMDTSCALKGGIKNPRIIENYDGSIIKLNEEYSMDRSMFPILNEVIGDTIMVTDGLHLLGGDDKAGITIILEFLKYYLTHKNEFKYNLAICFTPDEEIGEGPLFFDKDTLKADVAFTLDGESIYEASYENFNASKAKVTIYGNSVHPGMGKNVLINSISIANEFISLFDKNMVPEKSEGYEGFIHLNKIEGDVEKTTLNYIIRDFDINELKKKEELFYKYKEEINKRYPKVKIDLDIKEEYKNMKPLVIKDTFAIDLINKAYLAKKMKIRYSPIRGGTDGATITYKGVICPNLGVGDFSPHGRYEFVSITQMCLMVELIKELFK